MNLSAIPTMLYAGLAAGRGYVDIHTAMYPGGEIRTYPTGLFLDGFGSGDFSAWSDSVP